MNYGHNNLKKVFNCDTNFIFQGLNNYDSASKKVYGNNCFIVFFYSVSSN